MNDNEVWYQGKAFQPNAPPETYATGIVVDFHGEDALARANAWFQARKYAEGEDFCDAVYLYRIQGEDRQMALSHSDTYGMDYGDGEDEDAGEFYGKYGYD
jgi:hypothetical protein